tara:strand:+ start:197 stop:430 length:234 start_codon:yes stop_codon:yes gene_type:complete
MGQEVFQVNQFTHSLKKALDANKTLSGQRIREDNMKSNNLHKEYDDDEHEGRNCAAICRWNNQKVDMSYKRKLNMFF